MSRSNHMWLYALLVGIVLGSLTVFGVWEAIIDGCPNTSAVDGSKERTIDVLVVAKFGGRETPPHWLKVDATEVPQVSLEPVGPFPIPTGSYQPPEVISRIRLMQTPPDPLPADILHFPGFSEIPLKLHDATILFKGVVPGRMRISAHAPYHDGPYWVSFTSLRSSKMIFVAPPQCVEAEITVDAPLVAEALKDGDILFFRDVAANGPEICGGPRHVNGDGYTYAWFPVGRSYEGWIRAFPSPNSDPAKSVGWKLTTLTVADSYSEMPKFRVSIERPHDPPILARWSHDP